MKRMKHRSDVGRFGCSENESCCTVLYFWEFRNKILIVVVVLAAAVAAVLVVAVVCLFVLVVKSIKIFCWILFSDY